MAITINGSGTITGVSAGGLPDGSVTNDDLATGISASKLTGTLPAIDGSALTGITSSNVLQQEVRSHYPTGDISTTSQALIEITSDLRISFTPKSSTSKIIYQFATADFFMNASNENMWIYSTDYSQYSNHTGGDSLGNVRRFAGIDLGFGFTFTHIVNSWGTTAKEHTISWATSDGNQVYINGRGANGSLHHIITEVENA